MHCCGVNKLGPYSSSRVSQRFWLFYLIKTSLLKSGAGLWKQPPAVSPEVKQAIKEAYQSHDPKVVNSAIFAMAGTAILPGSLH